MKSVELIAEFSNGCDIQDINACLQDTLLVTRNEGAPWQREAVDVAKLSFETVKVTLHFEQYATYSQVVTALRNMSGGDVYKAEDMDRRMVA